MPSSPLDKSSTSMPHAIGRYQVADRLGVGGMGTVYLARDPLLERFVAIKVMRRGFESPHLRERFVREARAVASLRHPCIVTVFEYGDHDGQPFIVMEYIAGQTLAEIFERATPTPLSRRLQLGEDLCRGLHHAHDAGIVHRDVKPANIIVDSEGMLKILDFGIAKLGQPGLTQLHALMGTPRYMSPEQVLGRPVTKQSDIFSVGLVLYELLAYRPAFDRKGQYAIMDAIVNGAPTPLAEVMPDLDPRITRIVDKALEKEIEHRYQDLGQMRRDIERLRLELAMAESDQSAVVQPVSPQISELEDTLRQRDQPSTSNLHDDKDVASIGDEDADSIGADAESAENRDARTVARIASPGRSVAETAAVVTPPVTLPDSLSSSTGSALSHVGEVNDPLASPAEETIVRAGERPWFGDDLFIEPSSRASSVSLGLSLGLHVVAGIALVILIVMRPPAVPPISDVPVFVRLASPSIPVDSASPRPTPPKTPAAPAQKAVRRSEAAPTADTALVTKVSDPPPTLPTQVVVTPPPVPVTPFGGTTGLPEEKVVGNVGAPPVPRGGDGDGDGRATIPDEVVKDPDEDPRAVTVVQPKIPVGASGVVRVEVVIETTGKVSRVRVLDDTPYAELIKAAAFQCTFRPARRRGKPVPVMTQIYFRLGTNK